MSDQELGRLEQLDIGDQWKNEPRDFTPWLAKPENLEILGETLGLRLEPETADTEKESGRFRADIVCMDSDENWVLIENQLDRTDHKHLGQLLTYAQGVHAVTMVWLADEFADEHRAALDWLNEITQEDFRFFGLEIELWKIDSSRPAPKFNIVSQPNDWSRSVARRTKSKDRAEKSERRLKQREYWAALQERLKNKRGPVAGHRKPRPSSSMSYSIGRSGFSLAAGMNSRDKWVRSELYIGGGDIEERFARLKEQKDEIEQKLGYKLEWEELPEKQASRIAYYRHNTDPWKEADWPEQHEWLAEHLNKMHEVFSERIKDL